MCIYLLTTPMRRQPIGKMHMTPAKAVKAATRNAKRLGEHVVVKHWREGPLCTVFPDGSVVLSRANL